MLRINVLQYEVFNCYECALLQDGVPEEMRKRNGPPLMRSSWFLPTKPIRRRETVTTWHTRFGERQTAACAPEMGDHLRPDTNQVRLLPVWCQPQPGEGFPSNTAAALSCWWRRTSTAGVGGFASHSSKKIRALVVRRGESRTKKCQHKKSGPRKKWRRGQTVKRRLPRTLV